MKFDKEEIELLEGLEKSASIKISRTPDSKYTIVEWIVLDEDRAEEIENDLLNGIIEDHVAEELEIANSSIYIQLEQFPSNNYTLEERKELVRLYWKWILGTGSEKDYRQKCFNNSFFRLTIFKDQGQIKKVFE